MSAAQPPSAVDSAADRRGTDQASLPSADANSVGSIGYDPADLNSGRASIDELDEAICRLAGHMNAVDYRLLLLVREFDDRFGWAKWSFASCANWLAWRCGIGLSAAREKVRIAHALRDLPSTASAFEMGRVSYSKVRALTRTADAKTEHELLEFALGATATQVEERCRQIRNVRADSVEEARRAWQRRSLSIFRNSSRGTMTISVELPNDTGELISRALDKAVRSGDFAAGPEFGSEGWHAQQADALVAVARAYLAGVVASGGEAEGNVEGPTIELGAAGSKTEAARRRAAAANSADHYQVVVHVDETALCGGAGRSEMPIETVKRLACDASVTVVTENSRGDPLSVGRKHRIVPLALRRALWSRDGGCTFPACRNRLYVSAHHVEHWAAGGETSLDNTTLLCTHHHGLVHEGGLRVRRGSDGTLDFRRADGRAIPRCGYRSDDAAPDPVILDGFEYSSAEAWLSALIDGRRPGASVREEAACYGSRTRPDSSGAEPLAVEFAGSSG